MEPVQNITVLRPFCVDGQRQEVGDQIDVPRLLAVELVNMAKAAYTPAPAEAPAPVLAPADPVDPVAPPAPPADEQQPDLLAPDATEPDVTAD